MKISLASPDSTTPPVAVLQVALFGECMLELSGTAFGPMQQGYGGDTFNTAVYLQRCGGARFKTSYATALGKDPLSTELRRRWAADGISLELVRTVPGRLPGLYQITVDAQGERSFSFWRDNSAARAYFEGDCTPLEAQASKWDAFYFSGISLAILDPDARDRLFAFAQGLKDRGVAVVFDNNYRPHLWLDIAAARRNFCRAFDVATVALITADDHQTLFGLQTAQAAQASAQALSAPEIVIKRGSASTLVRAAGEAWQSVPTERVECVVDTTAAGDSFAAGYLSQRLRGADVLSSAAFGNRLAARVIQFPGAIIAVADMKDFMAPF